MISVFGSNYGEEEVAAVSDAVRSQWVGIGKKVNTFEKEFANHLGAEEFLLVDSGSNALFMAVKLLDLPPNSQVIVPSFTWVSCAQAILLAGHQPIFCDVDLSTQNVTADTIRPLISDQTKAVMIVHYAGKPVDMNPILDLGLKVIEDTAHAVDSSYRGKACGTLGDVGIFSFDSVKNLAMGEGGGLVVKDKDLMLRAKKMRYCGIGKSGFQQASNSTNNRWWEYDIGEPFIKMLPTDLEASLGLVQLKKLKKNQAIRESIWNRYQEAFEQVDWITCPENAESHEIHSYFTYFIQIPNRDQLAQYLLDQGVYTTLRYHPLHINNIFDHKKPDLPNSEHLNKVGLNIPLHPRLTIEEVNYIIQKIRAFQ